MVKQQLVFGTHTHVPTSDHRIMENGTAYQTDLGMCGDYNSVIGMNRDNSLKKFLKDPKQKNIFQQQVKQQFLDSWSTLMKKLV